MEMKPKRKSLGRNPLSDAPYRNPGMVLNEQGAGRHPRDAPCRDLGMVSSEQGLGRRFLSGALHRRPDVKMATGVVPADTTFLCPRPLAKSLARARARDLPRATNHARALHPRACPCARQVEHIHKP